MAVEFIVPFAVLAFFLISCRAKPENCSEAQCKLLSVREGFAFDFRDKASEKGVRIVYLNLKFRNDSYLPLKSENEFLPNRWVWANLISEPMLSLSYDYDILSMGLLKYQASSMDVPLEDQPSGCLANLNSSCQNKVVGRALLNMTQTESGEPPRRHVVCVATIEDYFDDFLWSFFDGNVKFQCCETKRDSSSVQCELDVQVGGWFKAFYGILNILTLLMMLYCPAFLLFLPDSIFNLQEECEREERRESSTSTDAENNDSVPLLTSPFPTQSQQANSQIIREERREKEPQSRVNKSGLWYGSTDAASANMDAENNDSVPSVTVAIPAQSQQASSQVSDDGSKKHMQSLLYLDEPNPITLSYFLRTQTKKCTELFSFHFKFAFLWYCVIPVFVHIRLGLNYIVESKFVEEVHKKTNASLVGPLFSYALDFKGPLSILMALAPLIMILISSPKDFLINVTDNEKSRPVICLICRGNTTSVGEEMILHLRKLAVNSYKFASCLIAFHRRALAKCLEFFTHCCIENISAPCKRVKTLFIVLWVLLWEFFLVVVVGVIFGGICLLLLLFVSIVLIIGCSPFICLLSFSGRKGMQMQCNGPGWIHGFRTKIKVGARFLLVGYLLCCFLLITALYVDACFVGGLSCRFITRMCGLVIFGFVLNASVVGPYVAFSVVAFTNIYLCYYDLQMRYQEVKKMISENGCSQEPIMGSWRGAIPEDLFWHICSEASNSNHKVLPVRPEVCRMLGKMAIILIFLFLVFCSIFMVIDANSTSVVPSTIAFFLSGAIPRLFSDFFKGLTNEKRFTGETRVRMLREITMAVGEYKEENAV